jgi:hypothetical protein
MINFRQGCRILLAVFGLLMLLASSALAQGSAVPRPPAQFTADGSFVGGSAEASAVLTGVRFGKQGEATRMVLDLGDAQRHPQFSFELKSFPYRIVARFDNLRLADSPSVQQKGALPFSIVTTPDGAIKELQIYLSGPSEFKVIEVDGPAKFAIDVRANGQVTPNIYTVQLTAPQTAAEAYALVERGVFPAGYSPEVLVIGKFVVVEQAFLEPGQAAAMDSALREMGYASVINERNGAELPQR